MRFRCLSGIGGWLLVAVLASGQTSQPSADPQSAGAQPTKPQPATSQPVTQQPVKPSAVAAAASASKAARESAPRLKVIRNHDISDSSTPPEAGKSESKPNDAAARAAAAKQTQEDEQKVRQFETQGKIFQNQIKVEKGKIIDIQNHVTSLKNQFAAWSAGVAQSDEAQACWTSTYYTPYYKDWCDTGRNLKAQYEATQRNSPRKRRGWSKCRKISGAKDMATGSTIPTRSDTAEIVVSKRLSGYAAEPRRKCALC